MPKVWRKLDGEKMEFLVQVIARVRFKKLSNSDLCMD